jgi:hypothetical protein
MSEDAGKPRRSGRGAITVFRTALAAMAASLVLFLLIVFLIFHTSTPARVAIREPAVSKPERVVEPVRRIESERVTPVDDLLPQRVTKVEKVNVAVPVVVENAEPVSRSSPAADDPGDARNDRRRVLTLSAAATPAAGRNSPPSCALRRA